MGYSVYKHTFPNGKVYIGITSVKPENRWMDGRGYLTKSNNKYCQPLMAYAINKYGWENIKHEILFNDLTKEEAEQKEVELIVKYQSNNREFGYNIENGGNSFGSVSEETKRKISKALKGRLAGENHPNWGKHLSEEHRKNISEGNKGKKLSEFQIQRLREANTGRKMSKESRKKISDSMKGENHPNWGKHLSEETRKKIGDAHRGEKSHMYGKHLSEETKRKLSVALSGENNPLYGKQHSEESKKKMSESHKGKKLSEEHKRNAADGHKKPVVCIETGVVYESIKDAFEKTGIHHIYSVCKGNRKTAGGYHWEYIKKKEN